MVNVITAGGAGRLNPPPPSSSNNESSGRKKKNNNRKKKNGSNATTMDEPGIVVLPAADDNKIHDFVHEFATVQESNTNISTDTIEDNFFNVSSTTTRGTPYSDNPPPISDQTVGAPLSSNNVSMNGSPNKATLSPSPNKSVTHHGHHDATASTSSTTTEVVWLFICFVGIMASFVAYGLLLEYTTSGGRKLHELSFLFVTSGLYTLTAAAGRYVRDETPSTIPPARFAILGLTSMGSTFCSVRSLRYVIFPIQVLAKSCKPVPVMLMGALMGKKYPLRKYFNVALIVGGVALFMGGGDRKSKGGDDTTSSANQLFGLLLLFISLCFDGGTGAYEDKLMSVHSVQPFDLMFNIQLGKTILAGIGLLVLNQMHIFLQMIQDMGFLLVALGLTGALGQVFIFITIAKFGALTCSIIGLARKVTTLVASIWYFGHHLNSIQFVGLAISVLSMIMDFFGKKKGGGGHHGSPPPPPPIPPSEELKKILDSDDDDDDDDDVELAKLNKALSPNR